MAKEHKYKFAKKPHAQKGVWSSALAGVSFLIFVLACLVSFFMVGAAGVYVGGMALMGILLSAYGFVLGLQGYSEEDCTYVLCTTGAIANGVIVITWLALYLIGV